MSQDSLVTPAAARGAEAPRVFSSQAHSTKEASQSLAHNLQQVALFLIALRAGQSWATAQFDIEAGQRAAIQAIAFAVLRQLGRAQAIKALLAPRKPTAATDALLTSALGLLCAQSQAHPPPGAVYADHVIVSQAVEAIKRQPRLAPQASFVNACLRRFLRERTALLQRAQTQPQARFNHPSWWVELLQRDWPADSPSVLDASSHSAPLTLRINQKKCTVAHIESALIASELIASDDVQRVADSGLQLARSLPVSRLPGYEQGWFSVQDAAAQLAAPLLLQALATPPVGTALRILDACAAPGGKTTHLLEYASAHRMAIEVLALDVDPVRCERIAENLQRLDLKARVLSADAATPAVWHDGKAFDAILLDAPCTASGIVRRHPDIPWLRRETDIPALAAQQKRLLLALWPLVRPGGVLLYCTCSVFKAEGLEQIESFVTHNTDALSLPAPGHLLPGKHGFSGSMLENSLGDHDGFFYALLRKRT